MHAVKRRPSAAETGGGITLHSRLTTALVLAAATFTIAAAAEEAGAGWAAAHVITASDTLLSGTYIGGGPSDFMLENDRLVVVISRSGWESPYSLGGGNIVDAGRREDRIDGLMEFYTYFDDHWPRQAVYSAVEVAADGSGGGPAVIRATGADSENPDLAVVTEYSLAPEAAYVTVVTTLVNNGTGTVESFELGDGFAWGDCDKYAPGRGFALWGDDASAWVAAAAARVSYGYAAPGLSQIQGRHNDFRSLLNTGVATLAPGDSAVYERYLAVGTGDIASAATILHEAAGVPTGRFSCSVADMDTHAPLDGAAIDVCYPSGKPYLQMLADSEGRAWTTLPPGTWHLEAAKEGYQPGGTSISVTQGTEGSYDFGLKELGNSVPGLGDTLTVIQRPLLNIPALVAPGDTLLIECDAPAGATGWAAAILRDGKRRPLQVVSSTYDPGTLWWTVAAVVPPDAFWGLYDLEVTASGMWDVTRHAVRVVEEFKRDYYFVHITDTHLPTHAFSYQPGAEKDSSEMVDLREVIADINIIHPEFVLITGDLVNEGELEDYLNRRYYSRAQRMLTEFEVPTFLVSGNHDLGGWSSTPPPDGTARRDWWRFFGWKRLDSPPPGAPWYTQNYSFDYGPVHYVGLEAYINYDGWRYGIYGGDSFTPGQMEWLAEDLAAASASSTQVLFYHYDFSRQINLYGLGVEMALWGHIHQDAGGIARPPYNLATNNVCDGERSYRLVRVSEGVLRPSPTVSAGRYGRNLEVDFEPANDGTADSVTAYITNNLPERFEYAMLKFLMPQDCAGVSVRGGTLLAVESLGNADRYYVGVDILPSSSAQVTVKADSCGSSPDTSGVEALELARARPNPFTAGTQIGFTLPAAGPARLAIYDIHGRLVRVLADGDFGPGLHDRTWDGNDADSRPASPGIYFARLTFAGQDRVEKMVLTR